MPGRKKLFPLFFTLAGVAVLIAMGAWQMDRRAWKRELIQTLESRLAAAPVPLPAVVDDPAAWAHRRVVATGRFVVGSEVLLTARPKQGRAGYELAALLAREDGVGAPVLVNRGFVPLDWRDPAARPAPPDGAHTAVGVVRLQGADRALTVDLQTLDGAAPQGFPEPVAPRVDLPNNHLQYALTWWALAAALATIYIVWRRNQRPDAGPDQ